MALDAPFIFAGNISKAYWCTARNVEHVLMLEEDRETESERVSIYRMSGTLILIYTRMVDREKPQGPFTAQSPRGGVETTSFLFMAPTLEGFDTAVNEARWDFFGRSSAPTAIQAALRRARDLPS
jgi:hypothetical protein